MVKLKKIIFETEAGDIDLTYDEALALYRELQVLFSGTKEPKKDPIMSKEDIEKIMEDIEKGKDKYPPFNPLQPLGPGPFDTHRWPTNPWPDLNPTCEPMKIMYTCEFDTTKISDY